MPISTLIVDDTLTYRKLLSDIVAGFPQLQLAGTAANGKIALMKMEQFPIDLVLLDVNMPEMDGMETLKHIRERFPRISVVMVSCAAADAARTTIQALNMGAMEFIRKPEAETAERNAEILRVEIEDIIRTLESQFLLQRRPSPSTAVLSMGQAAAKPPWPLAKPPAVVVIGVSTGGPNALNTLIPRLPAKFPAPVLIVQHMPPVFTEALAKDLNRKSALHVAEASDGLAVEPGNVVIAKGGCHMVARRKESSIVIGLNDGPPENSCRPAVDVLFRSVADCYGDLGVLSVILTGMGCDGLAGVRALKRKSCYCVTQTESSCVVYGMPRAVDEAGLSNESMGIDQMALRIAELVGKR